jgi:hypothetical protein
MPNHVQAIQFDEETESCATTTDFDMTGIYKTVWEISRSTQMAADRGAFIDQSQSFIKSYG